MTTRFQRSAFYFGGDARLEVGNITNLHNYSTQLTVEFWAEKQSVNPRGICDLGLYLKHDFLIHNSGGNADGQENGCQFGCFITSTQSSYATSVNVFALGKISHIAFVYNGECVKAYWNGKLVGTSGTITGGIQHGSQTAYFGWLKALSYYWIGRIAEFRVWNVVRTSRQIRDGMYRRYPNGYPGMIGYYPMDEGTGSTAYDLACGANGSFSGTIDWRSTPVEVFGEPIEPGGGILGALPPASRSGVWTINENVMNMNAIRKAG